MASFRERQTAASARPFHRMKARRVCRCYASKNCEPGGVTGFSVSFPLRNKIKSKSYK